MYICVYLYHQHRKLGDLVVRVSYYRLEEAGLEGGLRSYSLLERKKQERLIHVSSLIRLGGLLFAQGPGGPAARQMRSGVTKLHYLSRGVHHSIRLHAALSDVMFTVLCEVLNYQLSDELMNIKVLRIRYKSIGALSQVCDPQTQGIGGVERHSQRTRAESCVQMPSRLAALTPVTG